MVGTTNIDFGIISVDGYRFSAKDTDDCGDQRRCFYTYARVYNVDALDCVRTVRAHPIIWASAHRLKRIYAAANARTTQLRWSSITAHGGSLCN